MSQAGESKLDTVYALDPYHGGIRGGVLLSMLTGAAFGFVVVPILLDALGITNGTRFWGAVIGAIAGMVAAGFVMERVLLRVWPSGRQLIIESDTVQLREHGKEAVMLSRLTPIEETRWYFVVPRKRGTVRQGWYCVAIYLQQEENPIILYTFCDPTQTEQLPGWSRFERLLSRSSVQDDNQNRQLPDAQNSLRKKENLRWQAGAEMAFGEFASFLDFITTPT